MVRIGGGSLSCGRRSRWGRGDGVARSSEGRSLAVGKGGSLASRESRHLEAKKKKKPSEKRYSNTL